MDKFISSNIGFKRKLVELAKKQNLPLEIDGVEVFSAGRFRTNVFFAIGSKIHRTHLEGSLTYLKESELKEVIKFYRTLIEKP